MYRTSPGKRNEEGARLVELHACYRASRDPDVLAELVEAHRGLVRLLVTHHVVPGSSAEDLEQVAYVGLLKAIDRFDPAFGTTFASYATPLIVGEVRHHLRHVWACRVPRALQENVLAVRRRADELTQELGRSPSVADLAEATGLDAESIVEATLVDAVRRPARLPDGDDVLDMTPEGQRVVEDRLWLRSLLDRLPADERCIVELRVFAQKTQSEIAELLGTTQIAVSRTLRRTLDRLRRLAELDERGGTASEPRGR